MIKKYNLGEGNRLLRTLPKMMEFFYREYGGDFVITQVKIIESSYPSATNAP